MLRLESLMLILVENPGSDSLQEWLRLNQVWIEILYVYLPFAGSTALGLIMKPKAHNTD